MSESKYTSYFTWKYAIYDDVFEKEAGKKEDQEFSQLHVFLGEMEKNECYIGS